MWFPLLISFVSIWFFPYTTLVYNLVLFFYILVSHSLTYLSCFFVFIKQKRLIHGFLKSETWTQITRASHHSALKTCSESILHLVVIPVYKEEPSVIESALQSLSEQGVPMIVGLGLEERDTSSDQRYKHIVKRYQNRFVAIITTIHPDGGENEVPGKASNCDYCTRQLVKYYEENELIEFYPRVMVTSCDCDSIWCDEYFLYLNYLCEKNEMSRFDSTVYTPNITNVKYFQSNHLLSNWMSVARLFATHGHFRCLGFVRCFTSEYHIPLELLKRIDYWDTDLVHEDVHMANKLAILAGKDLCIRQTFLPCENQTPTSDSTGQLLKMLWTQSSRWNLYVYDIYYLVHQLLLNIRGVRRYEHFQISSWRVLVQLLNNYENLFFFFFCPVSNGLFWLLYLTLFNPTDLVLYLLHTIQPGFLFIQTLLIVVMAQYIFNASDEKTTGAPYHRAKHVLYLLGFLIFPYFALFYQAMNVAIAWSDTLRRTHTHSESALKSISISQA